MKYTIIIFLTLLTIFGCKNKKSDVSVSLINTENNYKSDTPNTRIEVEIENHKNNFMVLSQNTFSDTALLDKNGKCKFEIYLKTPQYFTLKDGSKSIKIFVEPEYNLSILYNSNSVFSTIQFTGKGAKPNIYLKDKYLLMLDNGLPISQLYELPVKEFRHLVDSLFVINKMFYNEFVGEKDYPEIFKLTELTSITYDRATQIVEYLNTSSKANTINEKKYFKFLNKLSVNNDTLLSVYEYRSFLNAYITYKAGKEYLGRNMPPYEIALIKLQTVVSEIENQKVKNHLLFTILKEHVKYYGYKNSELLFKIFELQCTDERYKKGLLTPYNEYKELTKTQKAPEFSMVNLSGKTFTLNDFKGSYIYVDVWASWCLPCRREAPFFEELKEKYRHKNIEFVSISVDRKKEDWLEYINLKNRVHNQFLVPEIEPFLNAYMIKTIPHFLIIDDKGNLIDNNASRPSEKKTEWIEELEDKVPV